MKPPVAVGDRLSSGGEKLPKRALAAGEVRLAIDHLEQALAICAAHEGVVPLEDELACLNLMGPIRAQLEGSGAAEVAAIYARSADLSDHAGARGSAIEFNALWGLTACILVHGRIDTARELAAKLARLADVMDDEASVLLAARLRGLADLLAGEIPAAIREFASVQRLYRPAVHADLRFKYASDQCAVALAHKAWAETIAGRDAEAEVSGNKALQLANALCHPHTSAHVTCVLAARAQIRYGRDVAAPLAIAAQALAKRHDFAYWLAWSELILAWHVGHRDPHLGIERIRAAILAYRRTGAVQALPYAHLLLADLALEAGDRQMVSEVAATGLGIATSSGVRLFDSEILRIGALAQQACPTRDLMLRQAVVTAQQQGAVLFHSRALAALTEGSGNSLEMELFAN